MDYNEAVRILDKDLNDTQKDFLREARGGIALGDADKRTLGVLLDLNLVQEVNFEHVKATISIRGIILTDDGEKVLQTLEARPGVVIEKVAYAHDDQVEERKTVTVKNATPDANVTESDKTGDADLDAPNEAFVANPDNPADKPRFGKTGKEFAEKVKPADVAAKREGK